MILENPEDYIDSKLNFSWERYFTKILVEKTKDSYLKYSKSKLNETYLHEKNRRVILESLEGIEFEEGLGNNLSE